MINILLYFNKLTAESFAARLKQADLVNKTDIDKKLININKKIASNKAKYIEADKKLTDLTKEVAYQKKDMKNIRNISEKYQKKDMIFC